MVPGFGHCTPLAKLWNNYILPLGYYSDSVKHAIIALGVAHRAFLENPSFDGQPSESTTAFNNLATRHYRNAVSEIVQVMADPSPVNVRLTLICCLVFVCFEIVRGQYDMAIQHLKAGSKLLDSLRQASVSNQHNPESVPLSDRYLVETVQKHFDQLCDITKMFTFIGLDASLLIEDDVVSDLSFFSHPDTEGKDNTSKPFKSLSEARDQLHLVELLFVEGFDNDWDCGSEDCWHSLSPCARSKSSPQPTSTKKVEWEEAMAHFEAWCSRLDLLLEQLPSNPQPADLAEVKALQFSRRSWEIFNKQEGPCSMKSSDMSKLHGLVDMAEDIVFSGEELPRPTFALAADIVPALSYVCAFCENVELERRIIDLLRGMKRREGVWDSQEMANLYELILLAKLDNQWKDEYNWETLPNLARMMANMSISGKERTATPMPLTLL
ncbi:hypothetical protein EsH8_X_000516 [Colletotrichum jinshuiense]